MPTLIQPPAKEFAPAPSPSRQLGEERIFHLDAPNDPHGGLFQRLYARSVPSLERISISSCRTAWPTNEEYIRGNPPTLALTVYGPQQK